MIPLIPADAGIQCFGCRFSGRCSARGSYWIPASAGINGREEWASSKKKTPAEDLGGRHS
jgi:hypothetical protein